MLNRKIQVVWRISRVTWGLRQTHGAEQATRRREDRTSSGAKHRTSKLASGLTLFNLRLAVEHTISGSVDWHDYANVSVYRCR